jgi:hypothetical protein
MALRASSRRDQRRRLLASRTRDASAEVMEHDAAAAPPTAYDEAARPERHPALATRLPVGLGRLTLAIVAILLVSGGGIALMVAGPLFGRPLITPGERFPATLAVIARGFDARAGLPVPIWLGVVAVLGAAAVAGSVKHMRRHRRDDYKGRFRAWGWLACLLTLSAWSAVVPLGPLVATGLTEATGISAGPAGVGWWVGLAGIAFTIVLPWAVLPLRERAGTAWWCLLAAVAWGTAAAMPWVGAFVGGDARGAVIGLAAWSAGAGLWLVAMLTAARSVIREVRGEGTAVSRSAKRNRRADPRNNDADAEPAAEAGYEADDADDSYDDGWETGSENGRAGDASDYEEPVDADADEAQSPSHRRKLSKAERRRLRKLARMNGEAA